MITEEMTFKQRWIERKRIWKELRETWKEFRQDWKEFKKKEWKTLSKGGKYFVVGMIIFLICFLFYFIFTKTKIGILISWVFWVLIFYTFLHAILLNRYGS